MGILGASCSFTRFRILDPVPSELWMQVPAKLKQFAFRDIDDIADDRGWGWTSFEDMLDTTWSANPPDKGEYLTFSLRLDTRRLSPAVLRKHVLMAMKEEEARNQDQGRKFVSRERRTELKEQVKLKLMARTLPIPATFDVVWATSTNVVYIASTQSKLLELFTNHFTLTFDLHIEPFTPFALASTMLDEAALQKLDTLEPTEFIR